MVHDNEQVQMSPKNDQDEMNWEGQDYSRLLNAFDP